MQHDLIEVEEDGLAFNSIRMQVRMLYFKNSFVSILSEFWDMANFGVL